VAESDWGVGCTTCPPPLGPGVDNGTVSSQGSRPESFIDMSEEPRCCKVKYSMKPHDPVVTVRDGKLADAWSM